MSRQRAVVKQDHEQVEASRELGLHDHAHLFEERPADCANCGRTAYVTGEERLRDRWTCYGCGSGNRWPA